MPERTMIYVTHVQVEAMTLATRIVVLANKGIAQVGTPLDLYERPENEFVAQFIGSPAMNLLAGEVVETGEVTTVRTEEGNGTITANIPTRPEDKGLKVNVGIRPEDLVAADSDNYAFADKISIVEALGEVTQLYFDAPSSSKDTDTVIAKLPGVHRDLRGKEMKLTADPSKVHLFSNGQSLLYR